MPWQSFGRAIAVQWQCLEQALVPGYMGVHGGAMVLPWKISENLHRESALKVQMPQQLNHGAIQVGHVVQ